MKKIISILTLVLILLISSIQLETVSATTIEAESDLTELDPKYVEPGDGIRWCSGNFTTNLLNDHAYVQIQTNTSSVDRSIQFVYLIRPEEYNKYSPAAKVAVTSAFVNSVKINSPYSAHTDTPDYRFHGSIKLYQVQGKNVQLKANDIVELTFMGESTLDYNKYTNRIDVKCRVQ